VEGVIKNPRQKVRSLGFCFSRQCKDNEDKTYYKELICDKVFLRYLIFSKRYYMKNDFGNANKE
jgi:hypothetical protein